MRTTPPDLTDDEVKDVCAGLKQPAAQLRYLQRLGVSATRKPNGKVLVSRAHYEAARARMPAGVR